MADTDRQHQSSCFGFNPFYQDHVLEANFEDSAMEAADNDDIALTTEDIEENYLETAVVENDGSETAYNEDAIMEAAGCEDDILEAVGSEDEEHQGWHLKDYFSPCFCLLFFEKQSFYKKDIY